MKWLNKIPKVKDFNPYQKKYARGIVHGTLVGICFILLVILLLNARCWLSQQERDIEDLKKAVQELVCIQTSSGWCFCLPRGEGNPHCSALKDHSVRIYNWQAAFPDPPRTVYLKKDERENEKLTDKDLFKEK